MILEISLAVMSVLFITVSYYAIKFALTILKMQESIETSLDTLEQKHNSIAEILTRPLFFENSEVRQVLKDIEGARTAIHKVAYALSENFDEDPER